MSMREHERTDYGLIGHQVLARVFACRVKSTEPEAVKTDLDTHTEVSIHTKF